MDCPTFVDVADNDRGTPLYVEAQPTPSWDEGAGLRGGLGHHEVQSGWSQGTLRGHEVGDELCGVSGSDVMTIDGQNRISDTNTQRLQISRK